MIVFEDILRVPFVDGGRSPATGFDCWGLVKFLLERHTGRDVGEFSYRTVRDVRRVTAYIGRESTENATPATARDMGAVVLIRNHPKYVNHVGLIVQPGRFIHAIEGHGVCVESVRRWKQKIEGFIWWPKVERQGLASKHDATSCRQGDSG
jgi:cell wall-associated NlpC family hydrolase